MTTMTARSLAVCAAAIMVAATLTAAPPARAEGAPVAPPQVESAGRVVTGRPVKVEPRKADPAPRVSWARPGAATLKASGEAEVKAIDKQGGGIDGLLFGVSGKKATEVELDYSRLTSAYGGSFGSRLRLVRLPACALTTPDDAACRTGMELEARNDTKRQVISADVSLTAAPADAAGQAVIAAVAGASGEAGDYGAARLAPSATWAASAQSGDFTWSYPMRVPPVPGSLAPEVAISYSSGSLDGRTSGTNNQSSWVGEGFDLWPGHIQRGYKSCADDGAPKDEWGTPPGDQCWGHDNATIAWNGRAGELIPAADGTWRLKDDDGTRIERLKDTGTGNGDNDGEFWKVTDTDGVQYYFGRNRLPGWSSGKPETRSAWTVPVFGDDDGEPCHGSSFAASWCRQAYQWNLDYVVDPRGNAITYHYAQESNRYARNLKPADGTSYVRGGWLERIEYGRRSGTLYTAPAPARVVFGVSERCLPGDGSDCAEAAIETGPDRWADVPWDLNCASGAECEGTHGTSAPTFWSRKRLTTVTTQVLTAGGHQDVDSWTIGHRWGEADIDRALLVQSITHTGHAASPAVTMPPVTFNHVQLPNRLDEQGDDIAPFVKYRVGAIYDESGGQLEIAYSDTDCARDDLPRPETNTRRCFPVKWTPPGYADPITDWFHKYVVTQVAQIDRTGGAPDMLTSYEYLDGAAWHFDDDDGLTKEKNKTWSQWRGYGRLRVTTGGRDGMRSQTEHRYLRGMNGDRLTASGGKKQVSVPDGEGGTHVDHEALAGFELAATEFDRPDGTAEVKTVNTPWRHQTASRTRSWGTTTANLTGVAHSRTWTAVDGGGWRQTETATTYETTAGLVTRLDDKGDMSTKADDRCVRTTYAQNKAAWLLDFPSRVETVSVDCSATPDRGRHVVEDSRSSYDGGGHGAAPTKGLLTRVEEITAHDGTTASYTPKEVSTYDSYGRELTSADALGNLTTTSYTDTAGLTTQVRVTGPPAEPGDATTAQTTVRHLSPAFGLPTAEIDPGGGRTDVVYDALGRTAEIWLPDNPRDAGTSPSQRFSYRIAEGEIVAVGTRRVTAGGGLSAPSYELLDGLLRTRQAQEPGPDGGRLISDKLYDARGNVTREHQPYYSTGAPGERLFDPDEGNVETQVAYEHDGRNRVTVERLLVGNGDVREKWRTVTTYSGGRVSVDPPAGETPVTTLTDARDQVVELRRHHGDTPSGSYDKTVYTYTPRGDRATVTDPAGNTWSYHYDLRGRQIRSDDPDRGTTRNTYDDLGRLTSVTDARGEKLFHAYDVLGRKVSTRVGSPEGPVVASWTYDTVRKGLPTGSTRIVDGRAYTRAVNAYDAMGRAIRETVTIPAGETGLAGSYTFDTRYKRDGTLQSTAFPAAGGLPAETVVHSYDELRRPTTTSGLTTYVTRSAYTLTGGPEQYELSTGGKKTWSSYAYEYGTRRLESSRTDREGAGQADRNARYSYDDAGNVLRISDGGADTQCFAYDHLRRLTEAWAQGAETCADGPGTAVLGGVAPYWQSFSYDVSGNRAKEVQHGVGGAADTVRTYAHPEAGQPRPHAVTSVTQTGAAGDREETYAYDATGNSTARDVAGPGRRLEWTAEGLLAKVATGDQVTSFVYDADGDRLIRREPGASTLYLPGMEVRAHPDGVEATRYYTHGGATVAVRQTTGVHFLATDHNGTGEIAIDAATAQVTQRRYTPFGALRGQPAGSWPGERGFVGGTGDSSIGMVRLGAREYDPALGGFISVDPIIDFQDPEQMNGYAYADNSPITFADPDGRLIGSWLTGGGRGVGGKVGGGSGRGAGGRVGGGAGGGIGRVISGGSKGASAGGKVPGIGGSIGRSWVSRNETVDPRKFTALAWLTVGVGAHLVNTAAMMDRWPAIEPKRPPGKLVQLRQNKPWLNRLLIGWKAGKQTGISSGITHFLWQQWRDRDRDDLSRTEKNIRAGMRGYAATVLGASWTFGGTAVCGTLCGMVAGQVGSYTGGQLAQWMMDNTPVVGWIADVGSTTKSVLGRAKELLPWG
ncbi:RHS repeat-associated core domain-containing protein [Nonomuraea sp. B5E05]|uniref:RHS repeat-associated core domain-containing protein n=1 Tax=Nonomuraea sp. B5E05 TaxID=3153569 RepID=UPI003260FB0F